MDPYDSLSDATMEEDFDDANNEDDEDMACMAESPVFPAAILTSRISAEVGKGVGGGRKWKEELWWRARTIRF